MPALDGNGVIAGMPARTNEEDENPVPVIIDRLDTLHGASNVFEHGLGLLVVGLAHALKVGDGQDARRVSSEENSENSANASVAPTQL